MNSLHADKRRWWQAADRVGATASFLCAIHCALLPFVLAALPLVGLQFLADHRFERGFVMFAGVLALVVLIRGFRRHQQPLPLLLAIPALALLALGVTWAEGVAPFLHSALVTSGGLLLAGAHSVNLHHGRHGAVCHARELQCSH